VRDVGQLTMVQVATEMETQTRMVRLGARHDDRVEVLAGISAGERLVLHR